MQRMGLLIAGMFVCGCVGTRTVKPLPSRAEAEFFANPCCQTTYALVGEKKHAAVPLILKA
ncbi:MAG: hypothetical protein NTV49_09460, partial [Kiritimatiellaeota bacterium]|nr:hypothetical protein [Kiritimatiellota bacterium]